MVDQINIIEPGDNVRLCCGGNAGATGTAIDVVWYSEQSHLGALVRVMSDGGISHFFRLAHAGESERPSGRGCTI